MSSTERPAPEVGQHQAREHAVAGVDIDDIERDPRLTELRRRQRRFVFPMTAFFLIYFMALVVGAGYARGLFARKVFGVINVAYLFALSQFVMTFVVAVLYTRYAGRRLDPLAEQIRYRVHHEAGAR